VRILWSSNAPWVTTGYGMQAATAMDWIRRLGHDFGMFAFWGLYGAKVDLGDVPVFPNDAGDYGIRNSKMWYDNFKADLLITHVDVWVLGGLPLDINWVPRLPIDHYPAPPAVIDVLKRHSGIRHIIVESKYGQRMLAEQGIEATYIPASIDTNIYKPLPEKRKIGRERYGWQDKFVIGMVATNHEERKNWNVALKAVKVLEDNHKGKIIFYMHTDLQHPRGINLQLMRESLGMTEYTFVPSREELSLGIEKPVLANAYNVMDVFLLPTKGEGFGVPIVEAQACGIPVITTKCTSQEELIGGGYFIEKLEPFWTHQNAWQFQCSTAEVVDKLEEAYKDWENGSLEERKVLARQKALEYDDEKVFTELWKPTLELIEKKIKAPRNGEGIQPWRLAFIPPSIVPRKVLDVGCGTTLPYKKVLERLGEYVGIDTRPAEGVTVCDCHDLSRWGDGEFGFVWMSEVLEHLDNPAKALAEAKRVGVHGVCLFSTPKNAFFKGDPDHRVVTDVPYTEMATGDGCVIW